MKDVEVKKYGLDGSRSFIKKLKVLIEQMLRKERTLSAQVEIKQEDFNQLLKTTHYFD